MSILERMRAKTAALCRVSSPVPDGNVSESASMPVISVRPERQPIRPPYDDESSKNRRAWRDSHGRRGRRRRVDYRTARLTRQSERFVE
jgi:hypothetical protein